MNYYLPLVLPAKALKITARIKAINMLMIPRKLTILWVLTGANILKYY